MRFVRKPDGNAVSIEAPQFLDEPVVELSLPFPFQERNHLVAPMYEFRPVSPVRIRGIAASYSLRIARIPVVLNQANFQDGGFPCERWDQAWCWFGLGAHFSS